MGFRKRCKSANFNSKSLDSTDGQDAPEFYSLFSPAAASSHPGGGRRPSPEGTSTDFSLSIVGHGGTSDPTILSKISERMRYFQRPKISIGSRNGSGSSDDKNNTKSKQICEELIAFDEKMKHHQPNNDKALLKKAYFRSMLRVSWNLIEGEILHSPDSFEMGFDIQQYYALHQSLTLEDLAKSNSKHTLKGLVRVVNKVLKHLEDLRAVEDYLRFVGRLHDVAGVDPRFLDITGHAFCHALDNLNQKHLHGDIWNSQVKETWQTFFRVVVRSMKRGYSTVQIMRPYGIPHEQKNFITEVWVTIQDQILHYLTNSLLLPLVMRSNRSILKYFMTYETTVACLKFNGSLGTSTLEKTKHGSWFLTGVLAKIVPHLDSLENTEEYLMELGRKHQNYGVRREHLDMLALVYCAAVRGVVATQGVKGGPLFETTRAWVNLLRYIVTTMKRGYVDDNLEAGPEGEDDEEANLPDLEEVINMPGEAGVCPVPHGGGGGGEAAGGCENVEAHRGSRCSSLASSSGGQNDNFLVMKRRNAFIAVESLSGADDEHQMPPIVPPPTVRRSRQFSLQF